MIIRELDKGIIELSFTDLEEQNTLFQSALNKLKELYQSVGEDGTVNVELSNAKTIQVIGQNVDTIRQLFCGDVDPSNASEDCPYFILGEVDTVPEGD